MSTTTATSIGTIAMELRTSVRQLERLAAKLELLPVLVLNNVKHYSDDQVELMRAELLGDQ